VRIVSLLPWATEIVFALGLGDDLAGRDRGARSELSAARMRNVFAVDATPRPAASQGSAHGASGILRA
jgi:hypothetical protein